MYIALWLDWSRLDPTNDYPRASDPENVYTSKLSRQSLGPSEKDMNE